ncbi:hypothetical protein M0R19_06310 [Candidatus Pacearchaeota archaeon]|jgi:hypothetical protein|nr:hypothetical protein [Candidatus Pacearchaeota archaeon]
MITQDTFTKLYDSVSKQTFPTKNYKFWLHPCHRDFIDSISYGDPLEENFHIKYGNKYKIYEWLGFEIVFDLNVPIEAVYFKESIE